MVAEPTGVATAVLVRGTVRHVTFTGFPAEALTFYEALAADNTRTFWQANKATFEAAVRRPMEAMCDELSEFGPFHLFRPHNDLRFSKDKPPYKTHQGAVAESEGGASFYVHLGADGIFCGSGYYHMASDQLERFRRAVDADATGKEVAAICGHLRRRGYGIGAMDELKTAPRGYAKDHPRIELIRRKGLMASKDFGAPAWIHTTRAATEVRKAWTGTSDLCAWLDTNVGPSTLPPPDFGR
jgi:uncharacterized protein (TIGR02453 family)